MPGTPARAQGGFTLLELLVVMMLVALATGLAAPSAMRILQAAKERGLASDMEAALTSLPAEAFTTGALLQIDVPALRRRVPDLPQDWVLTMPQPLVYGSNGVSQGGRVELQSPGREPLVWTVAPLDGAVKRSSP